MENIQPVVNEEVTTPTVSEDVKPQEADVVVLDDPQTTASPAGSKTDPALLLKSLKEEKEKRILAEEKLKLMEESSTHTEGEAFSDEGKLLEKKIIEATQEIGSLKESLQLNELFAKYPALKEKSEEFKEFRKSEHPRANLDSVAKIYLVENGLLESTRKGLEKTTGGTRTPATSGMSAEDVATLRKTDYKKYQDMLMKGQITIV